MNGANGAVCILCTDPSAAADNVSCDPKTCRADGTCGSCASASDCAGGLVCDTSSGKCVACDATAQHACATGLVCISGACGKCSSSTQCGPGLECDAAGASGAANAGTCQPGTCDPISPACQSGYKCLWSTANTTFACTQFGGYRLQTGNWADSKLKTYACVQGVIQSANVAIGPVTGLLYVLGCDTIGQSPPSTLYAVRPVDGTVYASVALANGGQNGLYGTAAPVAYVTPGGQERVAVAISFASPSFLEVFGAPTSTTSFPLLWQQSGGQVPNFAIMEPPGGGQFIVGAAEAFSSGSNGYEVFAMDATTSGPTPPTSTWLHTVSPVLGGSLVVSNGLLVVRANGNAVNAYTFAGASGGWTAGWSLPWGQYPSAGNPEELWPTAQGLGLYIDPLGAGGEQLLVPSCTPASGAQQYTCNNYGWWQINTADGSWSGKSWGGLSSSMGTLAFDASDVYAACSQCLANSASGVVAYSRATGSLAWKWIPPTGGGQPMFSGSNARLVLQADGLVIAQDTTALWAIDPSQVSASGMAATAWYVTPPPGTYFSQAYGGGNQSFTGLAMDRHGRFFTFLSDGRLMAIAEPAATASTPNFGSGATLGKLWPMPLHDVGGSVRVGQSP